MGDSHDHDARDARDSAGASVPPMLEHVGTRELASDLRELLGRIAACAQHAVSEIDDRAELRGELERIARIAQQGTRYAQRVLSDTEPKDSGLHRVAPVSDTPAPSEHARSILLVEDDALASLALSHHLSSAGYRVLVARNARQAELLAARHSGALDLLITDLALPGRGGGRDVARAVLALHPRAAVLFMSPYPTTQLARQGLLAGSANTIEKPCSRERLLDMCTRCLSETRRSWPAMLSQPVQRTHVAGR